MANQNQLDRLAYPNSPIDLLGRQRVKSVGEKHLQFDIPKTIINLSGRNEIAGDAENDKISVIHAPTNWKETDFNSEYQKFNCLLPHDKEIKYLVQRFRCVTTESCSLYTSFGYYTDSVVTPTVKQVIYQLNCPSNKEVVIVNDLDKIPSSASSTYPVNRSSFLERNMQSLSYVLAMKTATSGNEFYIYDYRAFLCDERNKNLLAETYDIKYAIE